MMNTKKISVIDIGVGNIGSIINMLKVLGVSSELVSSDKELDNAKKIILPGVGSFDEGMKKINESGIRESLNEKVKEQNTPILGICLGMQLMCNGSEEGKLPGLSFIDGYCENLSKVNSSRISIPHMQWNQVKVNKENILFKGLKDKNKFYFTHSYALRCNNSDDILGFTKHGNEFVSAVSNENIYGVQFHPEKSHKFGKTLFKNFINI